MRKQIGAFAILLVLLVASGCSTNESDSAGPDHHIGNTLTEPGNKVLESIREGMNYIVFDSPQDLIEELPYGYPGEGPAAVYVGEVQSIDEGRTLLSKSSGGWSHDYSIVVAIKVTEEIQARKDANVDGVIYVSMPRGGNTVSRKGEIIGDDLNPSVAKIRRSLPAELEVLVMAEPVDAELKLSDPATTVARDPQVVPQGTALLEGFHPQMVVFNQGTEKLKDWPSYTFKELVTAAKA